jgi:hypothetical protein
MVRDVVSALDYSFYAEAALVLFFASFLVVLVQTLRSHPDNIRHQAELPLEDGQKGTR